MTELERFCSRYGPRALVVGGSDGLGAAFARALAVRGLDLVLVARRAHTLEAFAERLRQDPGVKVTTLVADAATCSGTSDILRYAESVEVGLVVLNAALSSIGPFLDQPLEVHERLIERNCRAVAVLAYGLGRRLRERGRGGLVLLTSMAGLSGSAQVAHYAASKAYVRVLGEGLFEELRHEGVDVIASCPGRVRTPTYERSRARPPGWLAPPVMEPDAVVRATLGALGRKPVVIPGRWNSTAASLMQRLFPRGLAVACVSAATRAMYPVSGLPGSRRPQEGGGRHG